MASYKEPSTEPGVPDEWAELQNAQRLALSLPKTGMAVTNDIGMADDVHPVNKRDVGQRLALAARHVAYGESLVHSGPMQRGVRFADRAAIVDFDNGGAALSVRGGGNQVRGFEVAGADRVFHPARARIEASAAQVPAPTRRPRNGVLMS